MVPEDQVFQYQGNNNDPDARERDHKRDEGICGQYSCNRIVIYGKNYLGSYTTPRGGIITRGESPGIFF